MEISLGPAPFSWGKEKIKSFYKEIELAEVDNVFIGDIVCHKRHIFSSDELKEIINGLQNAEKKVFVSTLALVTNNKELEGIEEIIGLGDGVEANMMGVFNYFREKNPLVADKKLIAGAFLNIYNWKAAEYLSKFNVERIIMPFEISDSSIADIAKSISSKIEVYGWGNLSTALSWRCYTARSLDISRDECKMVCLDYPEGMVLETVDRQDLFIINGPQILSAKTHCLIEYIDKLKDIGVTSIRIEPSLKNTVEVINIYRQTIKGERDGKEAVEILNKFADHGLCNGWFLGKPGWEYVAA
ncbi:MAG: U32 family peptidase [Actinobacteria bacterium]|nr:U32 family peptidase [Actinomycetota bacterium]